MTVVEGAIEVAGVVGFVGCLVGLVEGAAVVEGCTHSQAAQPSSSTNMFTSKPLSHTHIGTCMQLAVSTSQKHAEHS
ncbi:hypothetical protein ABK046_48000, partial [Streptomyces caeruleatus]